MVIICKNCGKEYHDPGGNLSQYHCDNCKARGPLVRIQKRKDQSEEIIGAGTGVAVGAALAGLAGAIALGFLVWALWKAARK